MAHDPIAGHGNKAAVMRKSLIAAAMLIACTRSPEKGDEPGLYRPIQSIDLCTEREVFTGPSAALLAGRLHEERESYRESPSQPSQSAICFSTWQDGRRIDIWRPKATVMRWYVRKDKRYEECTWFVLPGEVIFGPNDVLASTPIRQTGPGEWRIGSGTKGQ